MSGKWINTLYICGIDSDKERVSLAAADADVVIARGSYAAGWLYAIGIDRVITLQLINAGDVDDELTWLNQVPGITRNVTYSTVLYVTSVYPLSIDLLAGKISLVSEMIVEINGHDLLSSLCLEGNTSLSGALQSLDGLKISLDRYPIYSPTLPTLLQTAGINLDLSRLSSSLLQVYPSESRIFTLGKEYLNGWQELTVGELVLLSGTLTALYVPPLSADSSLESFMQVIARLRAPDGCPWDRKQTHASLRPYLLEETYEALETLDNDNLEGLKEELGDLLLQIALHAQIASESGEFTLSEVLQNINRKIVSRHPHVFASVKVKDEKDVFQNWEKLKEIERAENGNENLKGLLDGIPPILPSLSQAQSIQDRAARVGFDWTEIAPVLDKVMEEMQEVSEAADENERAHELGDLLFAVVNLVRWYHVDAESALRRTNMKFRKRFAYIEAKARDSCRELQKMTLAEMDSLWEEAKEYDD